jgi:predicted RNA-binding Zn-ribbon protein involved in translation (DUF1610 family)
MRALSQGDFLSLWENGRALHPLDQGLLAIRAAFPESTDAADWPIGERNRALAALHCAFFGDALEGWMACPNCGEKLEFHMDGRGLTEHGPPERAATIEIGGRSFRVPTSRDLARLAAESSPDEDGAARLLTVCCLGGEQKLEWTEEQMEAAGERMASADPLAEIVLHFACPVCGSACEEMLDLAAFVWAEVEALAKRLALEVHTLASAYGWSEREILSLSEPRRRLYLEMVRA